MNKRFTVVLAAVLWTVLATAWYVCGIRSSCVLPILKLDFITTNNGAVKGTGTGVGGGAGAEAPTKAPTPTPSIPSDFEVIFLPDQTVYAKTGGVEERLKQLAEYAADHENVRISLVGHIANTGAPLSTAAARFNASLGRNRADVVKARLVQLGAPAERITTTSQTSQSPITENLTEEQRSRNRRVDVVITFAPEQ